MKAFIALSLVFLVAGCAKQTSSPTPPPPPGSGPVKPGSALRSFLQTASESEIRKRATAQALEDVRAGTPHVGWCGTVGVYRPNIPPDKERFVAGIPSLDLPSGCTDPLAMKGATFAMAYNAELVKHLPLSKTR